MIQRSKIDVIFSPAFSSALAQLRINFTCINKAFPKLPESRSEATKAILGKLCKYK